MPTVVEEIPEAIRAEVDAALRWRNREDGSSFRVTGLVDPAPAIARFEAGGTLELGLVLCQGDLCIREQVQVRRVGDGFEVARVSNRSEDPPAHLDPAAGARLGWLDEQLRKHAFVVLIFYRGFW